MVFGGSDGGDFGAAIAANLSNHAYVTGYTHSANFPTSPSAFQPASASSGEQAFVTAISSFGNGHIVQSTLLGASGDTSSVSIRGRRSQGGLHLRLHHSIELPWRGSPEAQPHGRLRLEVLAGSLTQLRYSKLLGAEVNGIALFKPPLSVPEIFAVGSRYNGGTEANNLDAFVVRMRDDVVQSEVLWHNPSTGELSAWVLDGQGHVTDIQTLSRRCAATDGCSGSWKVIGTLDLNRDGMGGELQDWLLNGAGAVTGTQTLSQRCGTSDGCSQTWKPIGVGDFNHDGIGDVLWHNDATGELKAWLLNGTGGVNGTLTLSKRCRAGDGCWTTWKIVGIGDFDDDGIDDLFWHDATTGAVQVSLLDGAGTVLGTRAIAKECVTSDGCSTAWKAVGIGDVNQDGVGDLLWKNVATGELQAWLMNGTDRILGTQSLSLRCDAASGCSRNSLPVGILSNHDATP